MMRLKVLIDASTIPLQRGGVGRYIESLVRALARLDVDVAVAAKKRDAADFRKAGAEVELVPQWASKAPGRLVWEQIGLPRMASRTGSDVIHSPHYTFPLFTRRSRVVTIHDLTFFTHPELHSNLKAIFFRAWMRVLARSRVTVVSVSASTADEFARICGANRDSVRVSSLGFDREQFHPPTAVEVEAARVAIDAPSTGWIAFLAFLEPRKNAPALIDAYAALAARRGGTALPALILAGGAGWDAEVSPALARAEAAGADVKAVGYLPLETLAGFLGGATLVAYPSKGEGFGLPVLEAMACGAPVLTTRELSLPEVGGDAVAYAGTDAASIERELAELLDSPERRAQLVSAGLARAATFTWEAVARRHVDAYRAAMR